MDSGGFVADTRDHLAVVALGGTLYAMGGRVRLDYRDNLSTVEAYNVESDHWGPGADMPTPRSGVAAAVVDEWIYVFGGESGAGTFAHNERYNPRLNHWETMAPMPTARHGLGAVAVGGHVYVVSGGPRPGGSYSPLNEIFIPPAPSRLMPSGQSGRTPAAHVGSVMAVMAVMHEAGVLPPESSPEANQLIHTLIQYQSVFLQSPDPGVREWFLSALAEKVGMKRAAGADHGFCFKGVDVGDAGSAGGCCLSTVGVGETAVGGGVGRPWGDGTGLGGDGTVVHTGEGTPSCAREKTFMRCLRCTVPLCRVVNRPGKGWRHRSLLRRLAMLATVCAGIYW